MGTIGVDDVALGEVALVVVTMRSATAGQYIIISSFIKANVTFMA